MDVFLLSLGARSTLSDTFISLSPLIHSFSGFPVTVFIPLDSHKHPDNMRFSSTSLVRAPYFGDPSEEPRQDLLFSISELAKRPSPFWTRVAEATYLSKARAQEVEAYELIRDLCSVLKATVDRDPIKPYAASDVTKLPYVSKNDIDAHDRLVPFYRERPLFSGRHVAKEVSRRLTELDDLHTRTCCEALAFTIGPKPNGSGESTRVCETKALEWARAGGDGTLSVFPAWYMICL